MSTIMNIVISELGADIKETSDSIDIFKNIKERVTKYVKNNIDNFNLKEPTKKNSIGEFYFDSKSNLALLKSIVPVIDDNLVTIINKYFYAYKAIGLEEYLCAGTKSLLDQLSLDDKLYSCSHIINQIATINVEGQEYIIMKQFNDIIHYNDCNGNYDLVSNIVRYILKDVKDKNGALDELTCAVTNSNQVIAVNITKN